jgi:hypothetical protein
MSWSTIGQRLIVRTLPLLMSAVLLAFGCTPAPRPVAPADAPRPDSGHEHPRLQEKPRRAIANPFAPPGGVIG